MNTISDVDNLLILQLNRTEEKSCFLRKMSSKLDVRREWIVHYRKIVVRYLVNQAPGVFWGGGA